MYSDRELLELAAKAAGLQLCGYSWIGENEDDEECEILDAAFVKNSPEQDVATMWNPLTDDGDALRLAGDIGLVVCIMRNAGFTGIYLPACSIGGKYDEVQHHGEDEFAATRRAIVRAAAAIGEAM